MDNAYLHSTKTIRYVKQCEHHFVWKDADDIITTLTTVYSKKFHEAELDEQVQFEVVCDLNGVVQDKLSMPPIKTAIITASPIAAAS